MASIHYVILFSIVYLYVYALICRICKCIEHCATARAYSKLRENGVMTKMSDVEAVSYTHLDVYKRQKECLSAHYLNCKDWMLVEETEFYYRIINKNTGTIKSVDKFRRVKRRKNHENN